MNIARTIAAIAHRQKQANSALPGYYGMSHQTHMPTYARRQEFTPEEQRAIDANSANVIPKIFKSQADSPAVDLASPAWAGVAGAGLGALAGGSIGAYATRGMQPSSRYAMTNSGMLLGAAITAIVAAKSRKAKNDTIVEHMRRTPTNATRRDVEADPVYRRDQDHNRQNSIMAALAMAAANHR